FFNDTATTEIYTLSLHDALPICFIGNLERNQLRLEPAGPDCSVADSERHPNHAGDFGGTAKVQPKQKANSESEYGHQEVAQVSFPFAQKVPCKRRRIDSHERQQGAEIQ